MKLYNKDYILKIKIEMDCFQKEDWGYLANNTWYFITNIEQKLENGFISFRLNFEMKLRCFHFIGAMFAVGSGISGLRPTS